MGPVLGSQNPHFWLCGCGPSLYIYIIIYIYISIKYYVYIHRVGTAKKNLLNTLNLCEELLLRHVTTLVPSAVSGREPSWR